LYCEILTRKRTINKEFGGGKIFNSVKDVLMKRYIVLEEEKYTKQIEEYEARKKYV